MSIHLVSLEPSMWNLYISATLCPNGITMSRVSLQAELLKIVTVVNITTRAGILALLLLC